LDGELWIGRRQFQKTISVVRRQDGGEAWKQVRYVLFDAPTVDGAFEQRQTRLTYLITGSKCRYARVLEQSICTGSDQLRQELARIEALGGEGLMLRQPGSAYVAGRSATLLKVKTFHDAEAVVVSHLPGTGRHRGRLGAVLVALPNGIQFAVGSGFTDAQRTHPPAIGSTITFRYQELTNGGVPRFPTFVRVRQEESTQASRLF
jgi:DNA ligase-1